MQLFGGEGECVAALVDHLAHLADTARALRPALVPVEDIPRPRRTRLDGGGDVALAQTIAVADVHGAT